MDDQLDALRRLWAETRIPAPELVQQINKGAFTADAVGHADITDILLAHDPLWEWAPLSLDESGLPRITVDKQGRLAMWGYLTVHGHSRLEVGTCMATSPDPLKELVGDFLRRGAMRFGVSLKLWSKAEWKEVTGKDNGGSRAGGGPSGVRKGAAEENAPGPANEPVLPQDQAIAAKATQLGLSDHERLQVIEHVTGKRSGKEVKPSQVALVFEALEATAKAKGR